MVRICVPSSGDNHVVFAFACLGAYVTSCDIAEKQLENARKIAVREGLSSSIDFAFTDTMKLDGVADAGIRLVHIEEMFDEKNCERPFWVKNEDIIRGIRVSKEAVAVIIHSESPAANRLRYQSMSQSRRFM